MAPVGLMELTDLPGVGPAMATRLQEAGYPDVRSVALAFQDELAEAVGRSPETCDQWIEAARTLMGGEALPVVEHKPKEWLPAGPGVVFGHFIMGLDLLYVGLSILGGLFLAIGLLFGLDLASFSGGGSADPAELRTLLWWTNGLNMLTFGIIPIVWVLLTRVGGFDGMLGYLGLRWNGTHALYGIGLGVGMVFVFGGLAWLLELLDLGPSDAPIEDVAAVLNWPLVIVTSIVAGFAEEVMFRGVLQKWLRWWGQGLAFGLLHVANAGFISFGATAIIGILLGYLRHRGWSLWALIIAHFVYDLILFGSVLLYPEAAGGEPAWLP